MKRKHGLWMDALVTFAVFFVLVAFVVTCCFFLFLYTMTASMGITLTQPDVEFAAKLTFVNVLFLSLLFSSIDFWRRYFTVRKPVNKILEATNQMMAGDFSARVEGIAQHDMNGFNQISDNVNKLAEELGNIETLRTDFIANVSHELKTPMAVIGNCATILQQPDLPEAQRIEAAKTISCSARRMASLVTNILKLNKLENQQIFPAPERYDLGEQLCTCLLGFEELWEKKNITIETDLAEDCFVTADPEMMSLVWNNLFSNAIKFTPEGGTVGLKLEKEPDKIAVKIYDTGCGISPEVGRRMFDKFYQGDTSHAAQGNGLGLALVKRIMDITGSEITVESRLGEGTAFTVRIREK